MLDLPKDSASVPRLRSIIEDPEIAWDARSPISPCDLIPIEGELLDELERNRPSLSSDIPEEGLDLESAGFPALRQLAMRILESRLDRGPGFVIVRGLEADRFSSTELQNIFWRLSNMLGEPLVQKKSSVRLGRVADLGLPAEARPRYHETGTGGSVHTDSPIMKQVADIVGLLCVRPAAEGGESKFVSVVQVHNILLRHAESLLAELYEPFYFDRRVNPSDVSADNPALLKAPIFTYRPELGARGLRLRWQPEYVWQAPDLEAVPPLTERQRLALHLLEAVLEDAEGAITVRIAMRAGDMQFLNNHVVAHGRTPFRDTPPRPGATSAPKPSGREMRRIWLRRASKASERVSRDAAPGEAG